MRTFAVIGTKEDDGCCFFSCGFCDEYCPHCEETTYNIPTDEISLCAHCGAELFPCAACDDTGNGACTWDRRRFGCNRFIHDDISDADIAANPLTRQQFENLVYEEFNVGNAWFVELFQNVLERAERFEDGEDRVNYLIDMLPDECPQQWIRRLKI